MYPRDHELIRPLSLVRSELLQVLLSHFRVERNGDGYKLDIEFGDDCLAIWQRRAKNILRARTKSFRSRSRRLQAEIEAFLLGQGGSVFVHNDSHFLFRWGSGGALPILHAGGTQYFCLFYRDVFPVGWNLANGGTDNAQELVFPAAAIEREFQEELVPINFTKAVRYVFSDQRRRVHGQTNFAHATDSLNTQRGRTSAAMWSELLLPVKWQHGPDSVAVTHAGETTTTHGVYLNINALDFGVEVDRVVHFSLDPEAVLCDGEVHSSRMLNRMIGLFEAGSFVQMLATPGAIFFPDILYHDGQRFRGAKIREMMEGIYPNLGAALISKRVLVPRGGEANPLDLCPATRTLAKRHLAAAPTLAGALDAGTEVFLSHAHEDIGLARKIHQYLTKQLGKRVFFTGSSSGRTTSFARAIDQALESSIHLVAVASNPEYLRKDYVAYECRAFHNLMLMGKKPNGQFLSVIENFDPGFLPLPFCVHEAVQYSSRASGRALKDLAGFLG